MLWLIIFYGLSRYIKSARSYLLFFLFINGRKKMAYFYDSNHVPSVQVLDGDFRLTHTVVPYFRPATPKSSRSNCDDVWRRFWSNLESFELSISKSLSRRVEGSRHLQMTELSISLWKYPREIRSSENMYM